MRAAWPPEGRRSVLGWPGCGSRTSLPGPCARLAPLKCTVKSTAQFLLEAPGGHLVRLVTAGNRTWVESRRGGGRRGRGAAAAGAEAHSDLLHKRGSGAHAPLPGAELALASGSLFSAHPLLRLREIPPCSPCPGGSGGGPGLPLRVQRGTRAGALPAAPARSRRGVRQRINGECGGRGGPAARAL